MAKILVVDDDRGTRHILQSLLNKGGHETAVAEDGIEALKALEETRFDLLLLDVWMPRMNGLELLAHLRTQPSKPRVVVMTSDDAPQTLIETVRENAFRYVHKPVEAPTLLTTVAQVLAAPEIPPIEVISARPEWIELVVPCTRAAVDRIEPVMAQLEAKLAPDVREAIAYAFRELLLNAVEWGGKLDETRRVRVACLHTPRMRMYRIADPGPGFKIEELPHAAIGQPADQPIEHMRIREEKGIRPGGFGLMSVQASVDELIYNEKRNEVVFIKYLQDA